MSNEGLKYIEQRLGKRVMDQLTRAAQDPMHARNLMETLPSVDRIKVLSIMNNPSTWEGAIGASVGGQLGVRAPAMVIEKKAGEKVDEIF
jgi:hypothetical protein